MGVSKASGALPGTAKPSCRGANNENHRPGSDPRGHRSDCHRFGAEARDRRKNAEPRLMQNRTKNRPAEIATGSRRMAIQPRLLRIPEAAAYLGATNWFVEELVRAHSIPFLAVGKYRVIDICDLDAWIEKEKGVQWSTAKQSVA